MTKHSRIFVIGLVSLIAVGCANETAEWDAARQQRSVESAQAFVDKFANGEHADEAVGWLELVQEEQTQWEAAAADGGDQALRAYINQYPQSRFQPEAKAALDVAIAEIIADFEPEFLAVKITDVLAVWRGPLAFSMGGEGGFFTGGLTFAMPDGRERAVVVAVLDDRGLMPSMKKGRAYIWRGGADVIDWREIPVDGDDKKIAGALGFDPDSGYISTPPNELAEQPPELLSGE